MKSMLDDDSYLDVLLEWGTINDIPPLIAELRKRQAEVKQLKAALALKEGDRAAEAYEFRHEPKDWP